MENIDNEDLDQIKINLKKQVQLNKIYLAVISRYKNYIEEKENISIAELPRYITPKNAEIIKEADRIKASYENYDYEKNFYDASVVAYDFVKNEIEEISIPLEFWFYPNEILEFKLGDILDKNILLCSLLISLGNPSVKVFVTINDTKRNIFVYYEFNNKIYKLDLRDKISVFNSKEEIMAELLINEETISYEFNDNIYLNIN